MAASPSLGTDPSAAADSPDEARTLAREDAFQRLAERHLDRAYGLARAILHDRAEAEDATHDAFVTAWRKWSTLRDVTRFEHWFDRILVNTCRNRLRRAARMRPEGWRSRADGGDPAVGWGERDAIGTALATLDPDHRVVVALRFYRDLTVDEIADRTGLRPGTVKSRLHYALRRLHAVLDQADAREVVS